MLDQIGDVLKRGQIKRTYPKPVSMYDKVMNMDGARVVCQDRNAALCMYILSVTNTWIPLNVTKVLDRTRKIFNQMQ